MVFSLVYLYCVEMYPTSLRATSLGTCSTMGRVGGIFALSIEGLNVYWKPLPFVLVGMCGVVAGLLGTALPETTGEKLPESIEEALNVGKNYKRQPCCGKRNRVAAS